MKLKWFVFTETWREGGGWSSAGAVQYFASLVIYYPEMHYNALPGCSAGSSGDLYNKQFLLFDICIHGALFMHYLKMPLIYISFQYFCAFLFSLLFWNSWLVCTKED